MTLCYVRDPIGTVGIDSKTQERGRSAVDSASDFGSEGQGFDPLRPRALICFGQGDGRRETLWHPSHARKITDDFVRDRIRSFWRGGKGSRSLRRGNRKIALSIPLPRSVTVELQSHLAWTLTSEHRIPLQSWAHFVCSLYALLILEHAVLSANGCFLQH